MGWSLNAADEMLMAAAPRQLRGTRYSHRPNLDRRLQQALTLSH